MSDPRNDDTGTNPAQTRATEAVQAHAAAPGKHHEKTSTLFSLKRGCFGCLGISVIGIVILSLIDWNGPPPNIGTPDFDKPVPADIIIPAYRLNRDQAKALFDGRRFLVQGKVESVRIAEERPGRLLIQSDNSGIIYRFEDPEPLTDLYRGDIVQVEGTSHGLGRRGEVFMDDARLVSVIQQVDRQNNQSAAEAEKHEIQTYRLKVKALAMAALERTKGMAYYTERFTLELLDAGNIRRFHFRVNYRVPQYNTKQVENDLRQVIECGLKAIHDIGGEEARERKNIRAEGTFLQLNMPTDTRIVYAKAVRNADTGEITIL